MDRLIFNDDKISIEIDTVQPLKNDYSIADYNCVLSVMKGEKKVCDLTISAIKNANIPNDVKIEIDIYMKKHRFLSFDW